MNYIDHFHAGVGNGLCNFGLNNTSKKTSCFRNKCKDMSLIPGGSIHFNVALEEVKKNKIIFTRKIGSFGLSSNTLNIYELKNKISFFGSFSSINDENNFKFKNTSYSSRSKRTNHAYIA